VYNDVLGLKKTIDNIKKHRDVSLEYIVIDGASTDGAIKVIEDNLDIISIWVSEKDYGIYDAMNKGVGLANGQYTIFLNAGDVFSPFFKLNTFLDVAGQYDIFYSDVIQEVGSSCFLDVVKDTKEQWWKKKLPSHQACIIKTNKLRENPFNLEHSISADSELLLILFDTLTCQKLDAPISIFALGGASNNWTSFKNLNAHLGEMLRVRKFNKFKSFVYRIKYNCKYILIKIMGFDNYYKLSYYIKNMPKIKVDNI
jgi:glycosyltransferase involved in cell wall biosynthesis